MKEEAAGSGHKKEVDMRKALSDTPAGLTEQETMAVADRRKALSDTQAGLAAGTMAAAAEPGLEQAAVAPESGRPRRLPELPQSDPRPEA